MLLHDVLHQPEIPQNTGNAGRTCAALGAKLWLVRPLGFRLDETRLRRAGLDYWEHLQWEAVDHWSQLRERLADAGRWWYFSGRAQRSYLEARFRPGDVLVFGGETQGLPDSLLGDQRTALRIPTREVVRSLNLAAAVAVAAYEAARQLGEDKPRMNTNGH